MKNDLVRGIARHLQQYSFHKSRGREVQAELDAFRDLLSRKARTLEFDDQPSDFYAVQKRTALK
jgi:hypothetical protein